ncbi:MAG TPA: hypothetical protein PKH10_05615 [bacterium]|nr:hypothetical protein [bacterium]
MLVLAYRWLLITGLLWCAGCNLDPDKSWFTDREATGDGDDIAIDGDQPAALSDDGPPLQDDAVSDTDTVVPDDAPVSLGVIGDIQQGTVAVDSPVSFEAVVTAVEYVLDTEYAPTGIKGLFVSQAGLDTALPWSGIYVFIKTPAAVDAYARGDLLEISGTYKEYYGASQVENATVGKLSSADIPAPALIADPSSIATPFALSNDEWLPTTAHGAAAEQWESVLIEVHDVTVTNEDLGHGQWEVTGGLVVDKKLFYYPGERSTGTRFKRITGILVYTYDAFKIAPRDADDLELDDGTATDDDTVTTDDGPVTDSDQVVAGTIAQIQQGEVALDTTVSFEAVVTAVEYALDTEYAPTGIQGLFVSQAGLDTALPWSGIYVFIKTPAAVDAYARGDLLEISGTYKEYYGASQVENATVGKLSSADIPAPALIADPSSIATPFALSNDEWLPTTAHGAAAEQWESVLIEVHDVTVTNEDLGHGQWEVTGGLVVDKKLFYYPGERSTGTRFKRITGILVYTYDAFKIAPRDADDVAPATR